MSKKKERPHILDALKEVQAKDGCVTEDAIRKIAADYGIYPSEVYETATFYSMLHIGNKAEHVIEVCGSTCCDAAGADDLMKKLGEELGISAGETTEDGKWQLRRCECLGRCDTSPNVVIDGELITNADADTVINRIRKAGK